MQHRFLVWAALTAVTPALAADLPLLRPTRDLAVEYHTSGTPKRPMAGPMGGSHAGANGTLTIHFAVGFGRIRVESSNGQRYAIFDTKRPGA